MTTLLQVKELRVYYRTRRGVVRAVDGVSFEVNEGETLAIIGESGSGKSSTVQALIRMFPRNVHLVSGQVLYRGVDLLSLPESVFNREYRWKKISIVFQSAMNVLNPVMRVRDHVSELIQIHTRLSARDGLKMAEELLPKLGLPPSVLNRYPHELSGGMKQRVVILLALLLRPELLILDEPTSALDVITQANIMNLLKRLKWDYKISMIFVTHDIALASDIGDKIAVMYGGQLMEIGDADTILREPRHPYTRFLLESTPRLRGEVKLTFIPGTPPDLVNPPPGCRFAPRCPYASDKCRSEEPPMKNGVKCWLYV